jgi:NadR type nicotinamide-nucleotide adenylyltransferase
MKDNLPETSPLAIRRDIVEGIESEFVGHGLAFGKFMPPTNGHLYFLNFARASCRKLTILVCSLSTEPIPGEVRYKWVKELFPDCNVVHHYIDIPQEPKGPEDIAFFKTWRDSIYKHCPGEKFDAMFASEPYGYKVSRIMDIRFVPVDVKRGLVQISGTAMRDNPLAHWEHLHPVVRPYFLKRVAIVGPESTGKSMLARNMAALFDTAHVAEYAREMLTDYATNIPGFDIAKPSEKDFSTIARGQIASADALSRQANRVMFCDTELTTTAYWSRHFFGTCPHWIEKAAREQKFDLYLLLDPRCIDKFYADDPLRLMPDLEDRIAMFDWWKAELDRRGVPYAVVDGDNWQARFQKAVVSVYQHIPQLAGISHRKRVTV